MLQEDTPVRATAAATPRRSTRRRIFALWADRYRRPHRSRENFRADIQTSYQRGLKGVGPTARKCYPRFSISLSQVHVGRPAVRGEDPEEFSPQKLQETLLPPEPVDGE